MKKSIFACFFALLIPLGIAAEGSNDSFEVYRFTVPIDAHPAEIIPAILDRKTWQPGYQSLAHLSGPRWEVGELVEHRWREDEVNYSQQEKILELIWEQRLTLRFQRGSSVGFTFYDIELTPTGVKLAVVMLQPRRLSQFQVRESETSDRLRIQAQTQRLKLEHLRLKKVLELKSLREMQRPPN